MGGTVNTLVNAIVIAVLAGVVFMVYKVLAFKNQNNTKLLAVKWMKKNGFIPDHSHFYLGTGIAIKTGDSRLVLVKNDEPAFHRTEELVSTRTYTSTESSGRPLGLAPGVVGQASVNVHNIDITLKNGDSSVCKLSFKSSDVMKSWEARLRELASAKKDSAPSLPA